MKTTSHLTVFFLLISLTAFSQTSDNAELQKMFDDDQRSRTKHDIDWEILMDQDEAREARVYELIKEGKIVTARDHYNSAMIFQHGGDTQASHMAVEHMKKAIALDSTINRWLLAAAIDRDLMRRGEPQIYGTQYVKEGGLDAKWQRYKIDSLKVTDEERKYYGVETLAEQKVKEHNLNLTEIFSLYDESAKSIDKTIDLIKSELKKGNQSQYNVSEMGLNDFGYQLMASGQNEEALKIFKLNTEVYPNGFNTFDSYGECLLKLNRKEEAIKAYQKSLDLNPRNDNARRVLSEMK